MGWPLSNSKLLLFKQFKDFANKTVKVIYEPKRQAGQGK
jgi:hypothetical protein